MKSHGKTDEKLLEVVKVAMSGHEEWAKSSEEESKIIGGYTSHIFKSLAYNNMDCNSPSEYKQISNSFDNEYYYLRNILKYLNTDIQIESLKIKMLNDEIFETQGKVLSKTECESILLKYSKYKYEEYKTRISKLVSTRDGSLMFSQNFKFTFNDIVNIYKVDNPNSLLNPDTFFGDTYIHLVEVISRFSEIKFSDLLYIAKIKWDMNYYFWKTLGKSNTPSENTYELFGESLILSILNSYKATLIRKT